MASVKCNLWNPCKKQNHICRSTHAAEIHSALDLVGLGVLIQGALTEVLQGAESANELLEIQNGAGHGPCTYS